MNGNKSAGRATKKRASSLMESAFRRSRSWEWEDRCGWTEQLVAHWKNTSAASCAAAILMSGATADPAPAFVVDEAIADIIRAGGPESFRKSPMLAIGDAVATVVRRRILEMHLRMAGWNLSFVGKMLGLGDASAVLRAIRQLNLTPEYERAKKRLGIVGGGHRKPRVRCTVSIETKGGRQ